MTRFARALPVVALLAVAACGQPKYIDGKVYPTYGALNADTEKSAKICYEMSVGNFVWSIIGFETLIMPIYFVGYSLYNPVRPIGADGSCNIDSQ